MSIHKMLALHPDVAGRVNEALTTAARHGIVRAGMCASRADANYAERMDVRNPPV